MESDEPAVYCSLDNFPKFNTVEAMLQFDKSMGVATTLPPVVTTVTRTPSWLFRQTFSSDPVPKDPPPPSIFPSPIALVEMPVDKNIVRDRSSGKKYFLIALIRSPLQ